MTTVESVPPSAVKRSKPNPFSTRFGALLSRSAVDASSVTRASSSSTDKVATASKKGLPLDTSAMRSRSPTSVGLFAAMWTVPLTRSTRSNVPSTLNKPGVICLQSPGDCVRHSEYRSQLLLLPLIKE